MNASDAQAIAAAKVLMVGAGGIGCELLKTLVMSGFKRITLVDLDTIETSNLNRQFLFRRRHVKQPKAVVAREAALAMRPDCEITAEFGNVKDDKFGVPFVKGFDVVLNGLDNMEARRHVNRLTLAAQVPLVESGTNGFLGQVTTHAGVESGSECFECQSKPAPKTYPVCTIRNTPDKPVHCVVWAKEMLFARLFGPEQASDLDEDAEAQKGAEEGADAAATDGGKQDSAAGEEKASYFIRDEGEDATAYAKRIFTRVFKTDVDRLCSMDDLWKNGRVRPVPLELPADAAPASKKKDTYTKMDAAECARVFVSSCAALSAQKAQCDLEFDKEIDAHVDFVAAASNLRMACFHIELQSKFDIKGIAGNIVHAVATTNAVVGGLITLEAIKLVCGRRDDLKCTFVREFATRAAGRTTIITPTLPQPRNAQCFVCGGGRMTLVVDTTKMTLGDVLTKVVQKRLGFNTPTIDIDESTLYEPDAGLEDDEKANYAANLAKTLVALPAGGIKDGTVVIVTDDTQGDANVKIVVSHQAEWDEEKTPDLFELSGTAGPSNGDEAEKVADDDSSDGEAFVFEDAPATGKKREREGDAVEEVSKVQKV